MSSKRWIALGLAFALFFLSIAVSTFTSGAAGQWSGWFAMDDEEVWLEKTIEKGNGKGKIAVLNVNGVIQEGYDAPSLFETVTYNHRHFLSMLRHASEDPQVDGMIIRVNSPGGGVVESAEIHDLILEIQEDYRKPIYVSMASLAASGGYYIAAPADKIFANEATITGSLGVIMQTINVSELAEKYGVKTETIKSGPYKDIMSSMREMTDTERVILQSMIDDSYEKFVDVIANGRNMERDKVKTLADGRIYSGKQALELGLVDDLGNMDYVIDVLREDIGRGELDVIKYEVPFSFPGFLTMTTQNLVLRQQDPLGLKQLLRYSNSPSLMYLYNMD
ncbi:signal peptide peptidase SppA [Anaerobacillus isosaccharinicus]|uniref:Signal peptide peptidase SppA n=1 Tax=Anaerobacillus isosaccharinicus TaxID=1532552 RepID=A0A1S2LUN9_9BACI|nr:signal peptide peptidase SppA [Anaerobacillus isosaccharinicus]MBA5587969.1 signal peptide peptidase SppA [Anaerobacillus isosaccharinicus]QOY33882.1 signal peptide peptidase SppA [Anaerobacillus isosaccharinicus]